MSKNIIIAIVVLLVLIGGGAYFMTQRNPGSSVTTEPSSEFVQESSPASNPSSASNSAMSGQVKEFTVTSVGLKYNPTELTVKKGDTVKITYKNTVGTHDLVIDEFNAATKRIGAGQEETIEFVADKAGSFEFYCSVPGHKQGGMVGTFTVTE